MIYGSIPTSTNKLYSFGHCSAHGGEYVVGSVYTHQAIDANHPYEDRYGLMVMVFTTQLDLVQAFNVLVSASI